LAEGWLFGFVPDEVPAGWAVPAGVGVAGCPVGGGVGSGSAATVAGAGG
jgi:hypothetical protein